MLAIKYTPRSWQEIRFQDHVVKVLQSSFTEGNVPNILLFKGPSGVGKTTVAKIFASSVLHPVEERHTTCAICDRIFGGETVPNLYYINGLKDSGVDFHRQFIEDMQNPSSLFGSKKIAIIDEAHGLSKEALETYLTPIENPKNKHMYVIFCTTEGNKIQKNLQSRTHSFTFRFPDNLDIARYLSSIVGNEKWKVPEAFKVDTVLDVVDSVEGNIRESINLLEQVYLSKDYSKEFIRKLVPSNNASYTELVKNIFAEKWDLVTLELQSKIADTPLDQVISRTTFEAMNIYYRKVLGVPLKQTYMEESVDKNYPRVNRDKLKRLLEALFSVKANYNGQKDVSMLLYTLVEKVGTHESPKS